MRSERFEALELAVYALFFLQTECLEQLILAARRGHVEQVQSLLTGDNIDDQDQNGTTALFSAASEGHLEVAKLLLRARADPNLEKHNHATAIYNAAFFAHAEIVRELINHRAEVNHEFSGQLPIDAAAQGGNAEVVELLLQNRALGNHTLIDGSSPLMKSAQNGNADVVQVLLKYNVDHRQQLKASGYAALQLAAQNGHARVAKLLLAAGADATHRTQTGLTAREIAQHGKHRAVLETLDLDRDLKQDLKHTKREFVHLHGEL